MQRVALPIPAGLTCPFPNRYNRIIPILRTLHPVTSRLHNREGLIGRVDFENVVALEMPHANVDHASGDFHLHCAVVEIEK